MKFSQTETHAHWNKLTHILQDMKSVVVAFSGGVDSGLLSAVSYQLLNEHMLAITIHSPVDSPGEVEAAQELALQVGFPHEVIEWNDLENHKFVENPPDRCYICKLSRLTALQSLSRVRGFTWTLEGSNADDSKDYRPGSRAVTELGVRSPLAEAGLSKSEIRTMAKQLGIKIWDKPSAPCLATRFPYGTPITKEGLDQVRMAETFLHNHNFTQVRVRHDGKIARIEVMPDEITRLVDMRQELLSYLKGIGYQYITLDLQGYRQGSMNEVLGK